VESGRSDRPLQPSSPQSIPLLHSLIPQVSLIEQIRISSQYWQGLVQDFRVVGLDDSYHPGVLRDGEEGTLVFGVVPTKNPLLAFSLIPFASPVRDPKRATIPQLNPLLNCPSPSPPTLRPHDLIARQGQHSNASYHMMATPAIANSVAAQLNGNSTADPLSRSHSPMSISSSTKRKRDAADDGPVDADPRPASTSADIKSATIVNGGATQEPRDQRLLIRDYFLVLQRYAPVKSQSQAG